MIGARDDRGEITLPGLLVASALSLILMTAVLSSFENAQSQSTQLTARNGNQQTARQASDNLAAALRNLASPTPDQPQAIDRAGAYDLVFQDVDPAGPNNGQNLTNVRRGRWCLAGDGTLYSQRQTWTTAAVPPVPSATACPGTGWSQTSVAVARLTNLAGTPRPLFSYDAGVLTDIAGVHVDMYVDEDPSRAPPEARLVTGVFLRNQNRRPTALFTAAATAQGIVLNASASTDPEGQPLRYTWLDGTTVVDDGITTTYKVTAGTWHTMSVRVQDPAGLISTSAAQAVRG
ncbi:hypothetical protein DSM112329_03790 [Paraconexibacter sp. AEG42_29]|uniref:PKD domain-containing protein n=1 Tax=Paraconexibacter sp. AEG42_29 TaxID=2997339 RepID=A0AAU7AYW6_9ACTN